MENSIIWLIDDNYNESETFKSVFEIDFPANIEFKIVKPLFAKKYDYVKLLEPEETACIIIDQKLKETGEVNYLGIEIAQFLRSINQKVPIYILTNFSTDSDAFTEGEWSVEAILDKSDLAKVGSEKSKTVIARILRRIINYSDYLANREKKFQELIRKSLIGEMSSEDKKELDEIQFERTAPILAEELPKLQELNNVLEEIKKFTSSF